MDIKDFIFNNCFKKNDTLRSEVSNFTWWIKNNFLNEYNYICNKTLFLSEFSTWQERIYCILADIDNSNKKSCKCGNSVLWNPNHSRYNYFCSPRCSSLYTVKKRCDNNLEKYNVSNPSKTNEIKDKIKKSFSKYANGHPSRDPIIRQKTISTCNEKYNADSPFQSPIILDKIKELMIKKHGVEHALQNSVFLDKQKATILVKYGVENFNQHHLNKDCIDLKNQLTSETSVDKFFDLGYSRSHTYKIIKSKGIELEKSRSVAEIEILNFLESMLGRTLRSNIKIDNTEFDIYDPNLNLAIEYNGNYWHSESNGKDKNYHLNKTILARRHGIRLIHIFSSEWENKKDIVKSRLFHIFGMTVNKIYARKCNIEILNSVQECDFFYNNHIQGYMPSKISYGLFFKDILVVAMSFSHSRFNKSVEWELLRFSNKLNTSVIGGFSKLLKYFNRNNNGSIISYADIRWSEGEVYDRCGFKLKGETPPGYYYSKNGNLESRIKYQRHKLRKYINEYSDNLSEYEIMKKLGYDRIWDCGNLIFILNPDK